MFTSLHALAQQATLMMTITPVGADQLRVNVTPMPTDTKAKNNLPQPLSLVATPAEFDDDFGAALATWQAPKRTLIQQALDAAGGGQPAAAALPAPKPSASAGDDKPGRKPRAKKLGPEQEPAALQAAGESAGEAAAAADQVMAGSDGHEDAAGDTAAGGDLQEQQETAGAAGDVQEDAGHPPAELAVDAAQPIDIHTLDLF